ncbi:MAG: restriction endonuclease subunit S [Thermoflavifilum sp.]|nr:MAG: restriction endonuclease subunit S [Thermoflavifilum sp.]
MIGRIIPKNAVLVTCIASIGLNAINKVECATNQQINAIICKDKIAYYEFIYYCIVNSENRLKNLAGHTAVPIINKK